MNQKLEQELLQAACLLNENELDLEKIQEISRQLLISIGEIPNREGLQRTPERVARSYAELMEGYRTDPITLINDAFFEAECKSPVLVRDIEFFSMCEHHLLPIIGHAHVEYIPDKRIVGLSKIPRIINMFARRLQVQERLTRQIAEFINVAVKPRGVAVVVEGLHLCSMIRGVQKFDARMTTSCMLGEYDTNPTLRAEFLQKIHHPVKF